MTILQMFGQSATLTVMGMGEVFAFLIIMVLCLSLMNKLVAALKLGAKPEAPAASAAPAPQEDKARIAAVIAAALRNKN